MPEHQVTISDALKEAMTALKKGAALAWQGVLVAAPSGQGPLLPATRHALAAPWEEMFGPVLHCHDGHGYSTFNTAHPTRDPFMAAR
jgi:hypothetical protein